MFLSFAKIFFSRPLLALKLVTPSRIRSLIVMLFKNPGNLHQILRRYIRIFHAPVAEAVSPGEFIDNSPVIIVFPVIDWDYRYQRPQQLAVEFAKQGSRVFYLGATPLMGRSSKPYVVMESSAENVYLVQLFNGTCNIPDMHREIMREDVLTGYKYSIARFLLDFNIKNACLFVQHPYWYHLAVGIKTSKLVYDCMDYHAGFHDIEDFDIVNREESLVKSADVVVASSLPLVNKIDKIKFCSLVRNGCEYERFSSVMNPVKIERPVIGYIGAVSTWFDIDLVAGLAEARPGWNFVIVGSRVGCDVSKVRKFSNVTLVDEIDYSVVPQYLSTFNVCLLPFKICSLTIATNPVKLYEYLASGRPVVSVKLPELEGLEDVDVFTANNKNDFLDAIETALEISDSIERVEIRRKWAKEQDWSVRAAQILNLLIAR